MNDRALELFKQAGATAYEQCKKHNIKVGSNDTTWTAIMASTLTELVVKECAAVCEALLGEKNGITIDSHFIAAGGLKLVNGESGINRAKEEIKKHFGV